MGNTPGSLPVVSYRDDAEPLNSMNVLLCTDISLERPSAGLNRLKRMRQSLLQQGVGAILAGEGSCGDALWRIEQGSEGTNVVYNRNLVPVLGHCRAAQATAQATYFYKRHLAHIIAKLDCDGVIAYTFQGDTAAAILQGARLAGVFVVADMVEWFGLSVRYLLNGVALQQARLHRRVLPCMDGIIGISHAWESLACDLKLPYVWIPSFAEEPRCGRTQPSSPAGKLTLTFIGHWVARERPCELLNALHLCQMKGIEVNMNVLGHIGSSIFEWRAMYLLKHRKELNSRVRLLGFVEDHERDRLLANSDAFVLLRDDSRESNMLFPTRLPEYMLTGNPVVLSATSAFRRCFKHGKDVWFVPSKNTPASVADALEYLALDLAARSRIGNAGQETARETFSQGVLGVRLATFLGELYNRNIRHVSKSGC